MTGSPSPHIGLTDAELRAAAYFGVGIGSEGSVAGDDRSRRLSLAGNIRAGLMYPEGNSGLSIGTLQTDLGQHPAVARDLVDSYQQWAAAEKPDWVLNSDQRASLVADLARDGREIKAQGRRAPDTIQMQRLDAYLATPHGGTFVHERDVAQVDRLVASVGPRLQTNTLYAAASADDQARLAAIVLKIENQTGSARRLLQGMDDGSYGSVADVSMAVDRMMPKKDNDYLESGRDHTLAATEVFIQLRNAGRANPIVGAWNAVSVDPLVNPTALANVPGQPDLPAQYATIKTLFLQPEQGPHFIAALERGGAYAWGRPQTEGRGQPTAGLYASGDDFVVWNRAGHGYAHLHGTWSAVERDDLSRVRHDGRTELSIRDGQAVRLLLEADPAAPVLRPATEPARERQHTGAIPRGPQQSEAEHPLLRQARAGVERLDAQLGRTPDANSERLAASLACLAREHGLQRIDHVVLSEQNERVQRGENVFVVQGRVDDPASRVAHMKTEVAVQTPVDESKHRLDALDAANPAPALAMAPIAHEPQRMAPRSI